MSSEYAVEALHVNNLLYETYRDWTTSLNREPDRQLEAIASTALLAYSYHSGRFADGALENCALQIGTEQVASPIGEVSRTSRIGATTLHVATTLHAIGGHSRLLARWIQHDRSARHLVVLTNQPAEVPAVIRDAIAAGGGDVVRLRATDAAMTKARQLIGIAGRCARVILHTHPHDTVPILAFARAGGVPVAMFNHAHFGFSLAASVSDLVINTFDYFRVISDKFRFARRTHLLPIMSGLAPLTTSPIDKAAAKALIGVAPSRAMLLTVGAETYYRPANGYDFFRTAHRLLIENSGVELFIMGVPSESHFVPAYLRQHPRCRFLGQILDPLPYYRAADLFLESFPFPSLGAVAEAIAHGEAFAVPVYGEQAGIFRIGQEPLFVYEYRPKTERDYLDFVRQKLDTLSHVRAWAQEARATIATIDRLWASRLEQLNSLVDGLDHVPRAIPHTSMIESEDCRALADWCSARMVDHLNWELPFSRAFRAFVIAARRGYVSPMEATGRVAQRLGVAIRARLGQ